MSNLIAILKKQISWNVNMARAASGLRVQAKKRFCSGGYGADFSMEMYSGQIRGHMSAARELKRTLEEIG